MEVMLKPERIILCVDDDPDDQLMVQETIRAIDPSAHIVMATNGLEGIAYLENASAVELPCLIIMDINMPLMDGKEAIARLRKNERLSKVPVVVFTTSSSILDKTFFDRFNVPFLTKPISQQELHTLVKKMLSFSSC
jgi:CheY-like chemotaxis protein